MNSNSPTAPQAIKTAWLDKGNGALTFGFDIGMASVGWAVLSDTRIIALGVRAFDKAEDDKGKPLNLNRRLMRTARNRLSRRAERLKQLRRSLRDAGLVDSANQENFESTPRKKGASAGENPWTLRAQGLDKLLSGSEWARVLYHLVKHRGFYANRKAEGADLTTETGKLTQGVADTSGLLKQHNWRTIGEMAAKDDSFADNKRNKGGSYSHSFDRTLQRAELHLLFEHQRALGSAFASGELEELVDALFWNQKQPLTGDDMLNMIGRCTFEKGEYRAPKNSYTAERFLWLQKLNHLTVTQAGEKRKLTAAERQAVINLPYTSNSATSNPVSYKQLRAELHRKTGFPKDWWDAGFDGLPYKTTFTKATKDKASREKPAEAAEEATVIELKGWHKLRNALKKAKLSEAWLPISMQPELLDRIALALSLHKSDDEIRPKLQTLELAPEVIEALLFVDFTDFVALSFVALRKIEPHLAAGMNYVEACEAADYKNGKPTKPGSSILLPPLPTKIITRNGRKQAVPELRNPVVFRAFNQARKVLNELVRTYGSPHAVHVELARELSKAFEERMEIKRGQKEFGDERKAAVDQFLEDLGREPKDGDLQKYRLYREQDSQCAYSQSPLELYRLLEPGYVEIDHILPYGRSFDDSQNNKVLVLKTENQRKGNRTPFEYLSGANNSVEWRNFEAWVHAHKQYRKAKRDRLLRRDFESKEAEFKARNLCDTRYITRLFSNFVRENLAFAPDALGTFKKTPIENPAGGFTSFLRARWGLLKDRKLSDLHHALDACVIAAATPSLIKRVSDYNRKNLLVQLSDGTFVDRRTGDIFNAEAQKALGELFPQPWPEFRHEVNARLKPEPHKHIATYFPSYSPAEVAALKPVLVSRAVKRRSGGEVHKAGIRSVAKHLKKEKSSKRTALTDLKFADLANLAGAEDGRNAGLIAVLKERLEKYGGDGKKAFAASAGQVHKPLQDGTPGPIIRNVKLLLARNSGVAVRGGIAPLGEMTSVDLYKKDKNYEIKPIYAVKQYFSNSDVVSDESKFCFRIFKNDLLEININGEIVIGYFVMYESDARLTLRFHDQPIPDKKFFRKSIAKATSITKYDVDVLGNKFVVKTSRNRGLA